MSDLLTVAQLREHIPEGSAFEDDALQRIIDANDAAVTMACGVYTRGYDYIQPDEITEWNPYSKGLSSLRLAQYPGSITEVALVRTTSDLSDADTYLLEDEEFWVKGRYLYRKDGYYWSDRVRIVYIPQDSAAARTELLIQLCKLSINSQPGMTFEGAATWQETYRNYEAEKQSLIWAYCPPQPFA